MPVYGDISVTATTADTAQTLWPATGEQGNCSVIEVTNEDAAVDLYINAPFHGNAAGRSWYRIKPGVTKALKNLGTSAGPTTIKAYAASTIIASVFANAP